LGLILKKFNNCLTEHDSSKGIIYWIWNNLKKVVTAFMLVILVLSAFAALSAPNVKAQTLEAKIVSYRWYVSSTSDITEWVGDLVAIGEVQNTGTATIGHVFILGNAYNSSNSLVDSTEGPALVENLLPGQKSPFIVDFLPEDSPTQDQSWVSSVTNVALSVATVLNSTEASYSGLTVPASSVTGFDNSGVYTVTGTVENNGSQTTGDTWVVTTFCNAAGSVVALNYTDSLTSSLSPGSEVQFTATPADNTAAISNEISSYSVIPQSAPLSTSGATPTPSSGSSTAASPATSTSPHPTSAPSKLNLAVTYAVVTAVVVIAVVLAVLMLIRPRRKHGQFEPPPPPLPPPPSP
jgi:hypothetical protein